MKEISEIKRIQELREEFEDLFKEASDIKYDMKFMPIKDEEAIDLTEDYASKVDDFIHLVIELYPGVWDDYKRWFEIHYNYNNAHRSGIMFRDEDMSGLNDRRDKVKSYFNYLIEYLIVINHFIMSLEFKNIYEECLAVK